MQQEKASDEGECPIQTSITDVQAILQRGKDQAEFNDSLVSKDKYFRFKTSIEPALPICPADSTCTNLGKELGITKNKRSFEIFVERGLHRTMIDDLYGHGYMTCQSHSDWTPAVGEESLSYQKAVKSPPARQKRMVINDDA
ncbi:hypothetical protein L198_02543 [Cryptococcus wingfieldii CBS 7118]|uniref:Uncharacterized protein n=1 Tax=Cryptococcus wingfieldii CBS 7118 TaxID=1295528 RepID=A0A1E3JMD2_9TREE|nr:hypothetical protein L198_02543 [Cryptococcus wingfieldii CBS 7118]ODO01816.1 hypothetical protein L198_02543 [Cryptococcus wingfieldii CBS 7118]